MALKHIMFEVWMLGFKEKQKAFEFRMLFFKNSYFADLLMFLGSLLNVIKRQRLKIHYMSIKVI